MTLSDDDLVELYKKHKHKYPIKHWSVYINGCCSGICRDTGEACEIGKLVKDKL